VESEPVGRAEPGQSCEISNRVAGGLAEPDMRAMNALALHAATRWRRSFVAPGYFLL